MSLDLSNTPLLLGSGQFGTPLERIQAAKATAPFCCADAAEELEAELPCVVVVPSCATWLPGEPPHAAASKAKPAATMTADPNLMAGASAFRTCFSQLVSAVWNCGDFVSIPVPSNLVPLPWLEGLAVVGSG